jgi:hypothetical protein
MKSFVRLSTKIFRRNFEKFTTVYRPVAAGTGGADGQCPPKTNCKIRMTINIKIVI